MMQTKSELKILRRWQVEQRTGLSRSAIYAKLKKNPKCSSGFDPTFPRPVSIGPRAVGWLAHEIDAWLAGRVRESRQTEGR